MGRSKVYKELRRREAVRIMVELLLVGVVTSLFVAFLLLAIFAL